MPKKRKTTRAKPKQTKEDVLQKLNLPIAGTVPFVPPKNWHASEPLPRGPQDGYMDAYAREWTKGPTRTAGQAWEWDVQLPRGGAHLNVDWHGNITHPKPGLR